MILSRIRFSLILTGVLVILSFMPIPQILILYLNSALLFLFSDIWKAEIWINLLLAAGMLILFYRSKKKGYSILFGILAVLFLLPLFAYFSEYGYEFIEGIPYFLIGIIFGLLTGGTIMVVEFLKNKHQNIAIKSC